MRFQVAHFIQKLGISPDQKGGDRHDDVLRLEMVWNDHDWLVVWNMNFMNFHILGISSSQLTNIFQRGRYTTNQMNMGSRLNFTGVLKAVDGICSQDHDSTMFWWRPPWNVPSPIREASSFIPVTGRCSFYLIYDELWIMIHIPRGCSWLYIVGYTMLIYSHWIILWYIPIVNRYNVNIIVILWFILCCKSHLKSLGYPSETIQIRWGGPWKKMATWRL